MKKAWVLVVIVFGIFALSVPTLQAAQFADILVVVDESGSMGGEHAWVDDMILDLEAALVAAGVGDGSAGNRYGLIGYGSRTVSGRQIDVGGGQFGTASDFAAATSSLLLNGGTEDGYDGINFALDYDIRAGAGVNVILITDEDRDNYNTTLSYSSILADLDLNNAILNAVVNSYYTGSALGVDYEGTAYYADGSGGYTTDSSGTATVTSGYGTTIADYVDLAWASDGAAWSLNLLRSGGLTAQSFTEAFIDIKVSEIQEQPSPVPEPATMILLGSGLLGLAGTRRKMNKKA